MNGISPYGYAVISVSMLALTACSAPPSGVSSDDPHYTKAGFFDMHVCHWPERPLFFAALVSTERYADLVSVEVFQPDGKQLGRIDLSNPESISTADGNARTFKTHFDVPTHASDGWYYAKLKTKDGKIYTARDYVSVRSMPVVELQVQVKDGEIKGLKDFAWKPLAEPAYYRVIVEDAFQDKKIIYKSDLLTQSHFSLPKGLLTAEGMYMLRVHARSRGADAKWGDFNHGSMTSEVAFSVAG